MNMTIDRKELKQRAKELMTRARPHPMLVTLVYLLIYQALSMGVSIATTIAQISRGIVAGDMLYGNYDPAYATLTLFLNVLLFLFGVVMQYGYTNYNLHLTDRREGSYGVLFSGFPETGRVVLMNLVLAGFYFVWALAVGIPAFVLIFLCLMVLAVSPVIGSVFLLAAYFGMIILLLYVMVRYAFSTLVLADDPYMGPLSAVRRSRDLLRGRNKEFFVFQLSFFGWGLLSVLIVLVVMGSVMAFAYLVLQTKTAIALGMVVGMLLGFLANLPLSIWLQPYIGVSTALYYRALSPGKQPPAPDELPTPSTPWRPDSE